jgi:hypothetical protein
VRRCELRSLPIHFYTRRWSAYQIWCRSDTHAGSSLPHARPPNDWRNGVDLSALANNHAGRHKGPSRQMTILPLSEPQPTWRDPPLATHPGRFRPVTGISRTNASNPAGHHGKGIVPIIPPSCRRTSPPCPTFRSLQRCACRTRRANPQTPFPPSRQSVPLFWGRRGSR